MQMAPSKDKLSTQTTQGGGGFFWLILTDFETKVRHLQCRNLAATVEVLAQTLCDGTVLWHVVVCYGML